jgi:hypothetical protein
MLIFEQRKEGETSEMECMICKRWFQPILKFQLCCSAPCGEAAGRGLKEVGEVREWLEKQLQVAWREAGYVETEP